MTDIAHWNYWVMDWHRTVLTALARLLQAREFAGFPGQLLEFVNISPY